MRALYDRADESENALAHTPHPGLEVAARLQACLAVRLFVMPRADDRSFFCVP